MMQKGFFWNAKKFFLYFLLVAKLKNFFIFDFLRIEVDFFGNAIFPPINNSFKQKIFDYRILPFFPENNEFSLHPTFINPIHYYSLLFRAVEVVSFNRLGHRLFLFHSRPNPKLLILI
jgi:hypothetical protein